MAKEVVERFHGRDAVYEVRRIIGEMLGDTYQVYRVSKSGERWISTHRSLAEAVARARSET